MDIGGLVPLPSDALATPVTFRVKRQSLRGILAPLDAVETGDRELSGEWVVGKKTWQRLQSEWKSSSIYTLEESPNPRKERVVLYIHGGMNITLCSVRRFVNLIAGAYYLSSAAAQRAISIPLAKYTDARIFGGPSSWFTWTTTNFSLCFPSKPLTIVLPQKRNSQVHFMMWFVRTSG